MKIKILCVLILLLTCQPNIDILSGGDNMDLTEIDAILAKQMTVDINNLLNTMYNGMRDKGYLRDDITVPNADHVAQFYNFLGYYVMNLILTSQPPVPKVGVNAFLESTANSFPYDNSVQEDIVKEIIENKKAEMISSLLEEMNN